MPISFELKYKKLQPDAIAPVKAHPSDLGFDFFAVGDVIIPPLSRAIVNTGIALRFPDNVGGILLDRSSMASQFGLHVMAGVIDPNYTGEIKVLIQNMNQVPCKIDKGDKIAQMILMPVFQVTSLTEVEELGNTDRGSNGFGSSDAP
jgi:dUTP pyrophosphatase